VIAVPCVRVAILQSLDVLVVVDELAAKIDDARIEMLLYAHGVSFAFG